MLAEHTEEALLISSTLQARLDVVRSAGGIPPTAIDRFADYLRDGSEEDLFRMSPLRWGRANGVTDRDAIELFVRAAHAGILEFSWGVVCGSCGGFLSTPAGLKSVGNKWCALCDVDVEGSVSESVEVAFTVSPGVRRIRFHAPHALDIAVDGPHTLFSGNVGRSQLLRSRYGHLVVSGGRLEGNSAHTESAVLQPGVYMVFVPASNTSARFRVSPGATLEEIELEIFDGSSVVNAAEVGAGRIGMTIRNKTGQNLDYLLIADPAPDGEKTEAMKKEWEVLLAAAAKQDTLLTGRRLLTSQTFQELFRAESIPTDAGIDVKSLSILFTDLRGSTQLYQRVGDFKAFESVRDHFSVLRECVGTSGGAVVKTIGDAVMAAFSEPREAVEAAVQMHRRIAKVAPGDLALKVGVHEGPCIAVHLNDRLDYFGTTVNVAARVQGKANGGEIVLTESTHRAPDVDKILRAAEYSGVKESVELRGIEGTVPILRLKPVLPR